MSTRKVTKYSDEFRLQIIKLYENGKSKNDIVREYNISPSTIHGWIKNYNNSGSFSKKDNLTDVEKENIALKKQNKQLLMENDILKQAALIMARK